MKINNPSHRPMGSLLRLLAAFLLLMVAFGANADDFCYSLYAKSGATPGTKSCRNDVTGNTPGGMGNYACINNIALIDQWCSIPATDEPEESCPVADPVYPGSGAVTLTKVDFVSGDDIPIRFTRTYRSKPLANNVTAMGPVWFHRWQRSLGLANANNSSSSKVLAYRENGEPVTFNWSGGSWRTAGFTGLALAQSGSGWTLTDLKTDTVESYSAQGVLLSERTRTGFVRTLTYDGSGRLTAISQHGDDAIAKFDLTLRFDYDDKGRIVRLTDPANGLTQYGYDANSNLVSVTWPDGNVRRYVYEDARFKNAITGEIDETGTRIATWTYDSQGRANAVSHPDSSRNIQFAYANGATTLSYGQSNLTMNFSSIGGMLRPTTTGSAKGAASTTWDAAGNLSSQTGVSGSRTQYTYDDTGRPVRAVVHSVLSGTSVTSVRYADATSLRPSTIASPGRMRAFVYDAKGNVTGLSEFGTSDATGESGFDATASGQQQTIGVRYDALNRVAEAKAYVNGVMTEDWVYFYDSTGNRETAQNLVTGWLFGDTARDAAHRVTRQNGNYREARIAYDARGRITRFTYNENATNATGGLARLLTVNYGYSADGRVMSRSGTVSKNGGAATLISSDEINQWLDNYEAGSDPVGPPANLLGWVKALQFVQEPELEPVCVECVFYAGPRLAWTAFQLARDPIWSMLRNTGKPEADAQQCAAIPQQLTFEEMSVILREAQRGEDNFTLGAATAEDAQLLGEAWVGPGARQTRDGSGMVSADGLRVYRYPAHKPNNPRATYGVQANFELKARPNIKPYANGHLNILP